MILSVLGRAALAIVLFASGVNWNAPPVIISSFIVGASTIPLIIRSIRENRRLRRGAAGQLEEGLETRLLEMEERQDAELNYVEEQAESRASETARRLAELENRLEFAERALSELRNTDSISDLNRLQVMTPV